MMFDDAKTFITITGCCVGSILWHHYYWQKTNPLLSLEQQKATLIIWVSGCGLMTSALFEAIEHIPLRLPGNY